MGFSGGVAAAVSLAALALGPALYGLTRGRRALMSAMDGFVLASVGGLALLVLLPELMTHAGWWVAPATLAGMGFPVVVERLGRQLKARMQPLLIGLVMAGLMAHAAMDGVALTTGGAYGGAALALTLGIVLHRLPVGLAIWATVRPRYGRRWASGVLVAIGVATIIGAVAGSGLASVVDSVGLALFQAFVVGSLLHVLVHPLRSREDTEPPGVKAAVRADEACVHACCDDHPTHEHEHSHSDHGHSHSHAPGEACCAHDHAPPPPACDCGDAHDHEPGHSQGEAPSHAHGPRWDLGQTLGAALGVLVAISVPEHGAHTGHAGHEEASLLDGYGERLLDMALEVAPALLLGYVLAGAVRLLPQASFRWLRRGSPLTQAVKGTVAGIPLPICSCGVVPLYQSLVTQRGVPASAAMAFLIATPELGLESILLSIPLLGGPLTLTRLAAAVVAAVVVGLVVGRLVPLRREVVGSAPVRQAPLGRRLWEALRFGLVDVVDDTAPWVVMGLLVAAALQPSMLSELVGVLPFGVDVAVFALLGLPMYVCASGATPLAAALVLVGISPGAALAFLLAGPATNMTTWGVLSNLHGRRVALIFMGTMLAVAIGLGIAVNLIGVSTASAVGQATAGGHSAFAWAALGVVGLVVAMSVLRVGPVHFIGAVLHFGVAHNHSHDAPSSSGERAAAPGRSASKAVEAASAGGV